MAPPSDIRVDSRPGCLSGYAANRTTEGEAVARAHLIAAESTLTRGAGAGGACAARRVVCARACALQGPRALSLGACVYARAARNVAELSRRRPMEDGGLQDN